MERQTFYNSIITLVADDEVDDALDDLMVHTKEMGFHKHIILLKSRYRQNKRSFLSKDITREKYEIESKLMAERVLEINDLLLEGKTDFPSKKTDKIKWALLPLYKKP